MSNLEYESNSNLKRKLYTIYNRLNRTSSIQGYEGLRNRNSRTIHNIKKELQRRNISSSIPKGLVHNRLVNYNSNNSRSSSPSLDSRRRKTRRNRR